MTRLLVTSASGANGSGYGAVLSFTSDGQLLGSFGMDDRVDDPRGFCLDPTGQLVYLNASVDRLVAFDLEGTLVLDSGRIDGLDPGGAVFAHDGRYCVTVRGRGTIVAFSPELDSPGTALIPDASVPFPRGFAFGSTGELYLSSGIGPDGKGENTIVVFSLAGEMVNPRLVNDPELSPLDMTIGPSGNLLVNSEWPFGQPEAHATVREYDPETGALIRVLSPSDGVGFARPRGLRLTPHDRLYSVGRDHVIAFKYTTGEFLGVVAHLADLYGQAVLVLP